MPIMRSADASPTCWSCSPTLPAIEHDGHWSRWRRGRRACPARSRCSGLSSVRWGSCCATSLPTWRRSSACSLPAEPVVVINPCRGDDRTRADIEALDLPFIVGEPADLASLVPTGPTLVSISGLDAPPLVVAGGGRDAGRPGVAVRMLTSGTTVHPSESTSARHAGTQRDRSGTGPITAADRTAEGVAIVNAPMVHIGGVFRVLQCVGEARPFVLLDRFDLDRWADAVRRHRPRAVSLVPAALRMVLHSDLAPRGSREHPRSHIGHRAAVGRGCRRIHSKVRHPRADILCRNRIRWRRRRLDAGRPSEVLAGQARKRRTANPGSARVVDDDGDPLGPDQPGLLEVKPGQLGPSADWMRTTDMARIDEDGFLWILGRADQAIIRGGFKVMPDDVRAALESHPAVRGRGRGGGPTTASERPRSRWWS